MSLAPVSSRVVSAIRVCPRKGCTVYLQGGRAGLELHFGVLHPGEPIPVPPPQPRRRIRPAPEQPALFDLPEGAT
ncbi:hypothetical protein RCO28_27665 [Streptomyces sp. LHD-70]|uniref:hypothetical protein n=1 Tax=Streptomyces sp. LHD-70 TaxID=3072140 RepID=UPI0028106470|nr:hypothetical protein [Streptomyces sp. LHD-70]MDQ8706219.1 hypothetical protein [Streptomyces sp. LHD-70]